MNKANMPVFIGIAFVAGLAVLGAWWKISVWQECRAVNSFWYCMHIIGPS